MRCYRDFGGKNFNPFYFDIIRKIRWNPEGVSGRECFKTWDSEGRIPSTREPYVMMQIMSGKSILNLMIKQWSEGINDGLFCMGEFQESHPWLPDWVWDSVRGQMHEKLKPWEFRWHVQLLRDRYK